MPRPKKIIPPIKVGITLPEDVYARLRLYLFSEVEGRVPQGDYQAFFIARINEFFSQRTLDLAPFANTDGGVFIVRGNADTIALLERTLKGEIK